MSLADILLTKSLALIIELHNLEPGTFRRHRLVALCRCFVFP
jgi:hypothetical protein